MTEKQNTTGQSAQPRKEHQDLPNIPATSSAQPSEEKLKKEIKRTSELNPDGKTDNTEKKNPQR